MRLVRTPTFAALVHPQFRLLWAGVATSRIGDAMHQFAVGWLLVEIAFREGAPHLVPFYLGLVGLARGGPSLLSTLLGGVYADRMDRRRLLIGSRVMGTISAVVLATLVITDQATLASVIVLTAASAISDGVDAPTRQAMVPTLVPARDLMSAHGLYISTVSASTIVGPIIGGILVVPFGVAGVMVVKTLFYVGGLATIMALMPVPMVATLARVGIARSLIDGVSFVGREPVLRWVMGLSFVAGMFGRSFNGMLPAVAAEFDVGATGLSWMLALTGAGALIGSMLSASLGSMSRRGVVLAASMFVWGTLILLFSVQRSFTGVLILVGLPSLAWFVFTPISLVVSQTLSPDGLRARVSSVYTLSASAGVSLGSFVLGAVATSIGIMPALGAGGLVVALLGGYALLRARALRQMTSRSDSLSTIAGGVAG